MKIDLVSYYFYFKKYHQYMGFVEASYYMFTDDELDAERQVVLDEWADIDSEI